MSRGGLVSVSALVLISSLACGGDGPSKARVQRWADALGQGKGEGACELVCAHRDQLARRCSEQRDFLEKHAPGIVGGRVSLSDVVVTERGTWVEARVTGSSPRGTSTAKVTFVCADGRDAYPSSCTSSHPEAWWVLDVGP